MKIALLADIHANFAALQTIADDIESWQPDLVIVAGDLVNRGPRPRECLEFVHQRIQGGNWFWLRGNHEDYVIDQSIAINEADHAAAEVHRASRWTLEQIASHQNPNKKSSDKTNPGVPLDSGNLELLKNMPFQINLLDSAGRLVSFVHASRKGIRDGIYPETSDETLKSKIFTDCPPGNEESIAWIGAPGEYIKMALFGVGHTHRPLVRYLDDLLVVNAGSAGLPFDLDTRPSYARLTFHKNQWTAEIRRCEYDLQQAEKDFYLSGYLEDGGPLVKLVLIELQTARSQLYQWAIRYQQRAMQGEISMDESVKHYLSH